MARPARPPWKRLNPRKRAKKASTHLTRGEKSAARARARRAGRRYPNLVDNMRMAAKKNARTKKRSRKSARRKAVAKTPARRRAASAREKDPRGGLTAAGRKAFARKQGAHLKPGVTRKASEMTPQDMRRKGSWAVRFYGRVKLPPLVDARGRPTRHALSAHAWGEPVPKTVAAARRIAAKGKRLLARYQRAKTKH